MTKYATHSRVCVTISATLYDAVLQSKAPPI
jgi:hypothetical protein